MDLSVFDTIPDKILVKIYEPILEPVETYNDVPLTLFNDDPPPANKKKSNSTPWNTVGPGKKQINFQRQK